MPWNVNICMSIFAFQSYHHLPWTEMLSGDEDVSLSSLIALFLLDVSDFLLSLSLLLLLLLSTLTWWLAIAAFNKSRAESFKLSWRISEGVMLGFEVKDISFLLRYQREKEGKKKKENDSNFFFSLLLNNWFQERLFFARETMNIANESSESKCLQGLTVTVRGKMISLWTSTNGLVLPLRCQ